MRRGRAGVRTSSSRGRAVPAGRRGGMRARRNLSACSASAGRRRASSSWALLALGRPRAAVLFPEALALLRRRPTPLFPEALALLRRQLAEALARLGALLRGHVPPALIVLHDALPVGGQHRLPLAVALEDVVAPVRGELLEALVRLLQLLPPRLRQLVPALEVSDDPRPFVRRERPVALEALFRDRKSTRLNSSH